MEQQVSGMVCASYCHMMKTVRPWSFLIIALLIGWVGGSFLSDNYYKKWIKNYMTRNALVGVSDRFAALNMLRAGETNRAAELLESQMDSEVIVLGAMIQDVPAAQRPADDIRLLTRLRDYRAAYPRKTSRPEIDQTVAGVFSLTNPQNQP
jgi:hypothetical protein